MKFAGCCSPRRFRVHFFSCASGYGRSWRLQYVSNAGKTAGEGCIFCTKPAEQQDAENLILWRSTYCFALLNLYPYTSGHTMVAPYRHTADIADLTPDESLDLWQPDAKVRARHSAGLQARWVQYPVLI